MNGLTLVAVVLGFGVIDIILGFVVFRLWRFWRTDALLFQAKVTGVVLALSVSLIVSAAIASPRAITPAITLAVFGAECLFILSCGLVKLREHSPDLVGGVLQRHPHLEEAIERHTVSRVVRDAFRRRGSL